jgi:peroxiredoxin
MRFASLPTSLFAFTCLVASVLPGAGSAEPDTPGFPPGPYRGVLASAGGELPFQFELARSGERYSAVLINGAERSPVDKVLVEKGTLIMEWSGYGNSLQARYEGAALVGTLKLARRGGVIDEIPFTARHGETHRFFSVPDAAPARFAGRWEVTFTRKDGTSFPAVAEIEQSGASLSGTFLTETGDQRFLAGEAQGRRLFLSTFFGTTPSLHVATLQPDGTLSGEQWSGKSGYSTWKARPNARATLRDPLAITYLKPGYERFDFTFPNLEGKKVSLSDPRYRGKVVVVTISGSWCPNCHDEAAFMAPFYKENRGRGLEAIELMYEYSGNFQEAAAAVRRFKEKFGIEYEMLIAGVSDKDQASKTLPMLSEVFAYPTTLIIDRRGVLRRVHTGFTGPGTGEHYRHYVEEFTEFIENLLAEGT